MSKNRNEHGFTLVELSIVLIIIGLIVGGVLKGQELIESAQLKSVMVQANNTRTATTTFLDKYDALPGDFSQATTQILATLTDGDRDGTIEGAGLDSETLQYWQHMSAAGIITGIPGTAGSIGSGAPTSKIGGGFTIENTAVNGTTTHWLRLGDGNNGNRNTNAVLRPAQARSIDQKSDDGLPQTGVIRSANGNGLTGANACLNGTNYRLLDAVACITYFQL